jgi:hypothetical protein
MGRPPPEGDDAPETGAVRLLRDVVAHDCGRVVSPVIVDGQVRGGVVPGAACRRPPAPPGLRLEKRMSSKASVLLGILLLTPASVLAGPIYGSVRDGPNPLRSAQIEIACPDFRPGAVRVQGQTDDLGSFRLNVLPRGRCLLRVGNAVPTIIYSSDNAIRYDFDVVSGPSGRELRRH